MRKRDKICIDLRGFARMQSGNGGQPPLEPRAKIDGPVALQSLLYSSRQEPRTTLPTAEQIPDVLPRSQTDSRAEHWADVVVIGAGPTGLACAIEVHKIGAKVTVLDKGCLVNSIFHYPANMTFFTTPELLALG